MIGQSNETFLRAVAVWIALSTSTVSGYEINNHADMSQTAAEQFSVLRSTDKLRSLGLKPLELQDSKQTFPLDATLLPIPYCFGSDRPAKWKVTIPVGDSNFPTGQRDGTQTQPDWSSPKLTLAQMIRYGACFEDADDPNKRPLTHFYNPQDFGLGQTVLGNPIAANSLVWTLTRNNPYPTALTGTNHYTWEDARESFYDALTLSLPNASREYNAWNRNYYWGKTFQALGHMVHHLQDMGSPQHVRDDSHCNDETWCRQYGQYRPSGYEAYWEAKFDLIQGLARTATAPMVFGLPREFWNINTTDSLLTLNPVRYMNADEGMAAYTATNFTSVGKDFRGGNIFSSGLPRPASGLPLPAPSGQYKDVNVTALFPPENAATLATLCGGTTVGCNMRFMGTTQNPDAKTSAVSIFARDLLVPRDPNNPLEPTYTGTGFFTQNFFTYTDAAVKVVPKAVEYSAGLINYFFRGELTIRPPEEGIYGLLDGGDTNSNCKDTCGFRKIRARVTNTTAPIGTSPQDMTAGTLTAVVKFSRNSCYLPDWSGDAGQLGTIPAAQRRACYQNGADVPVEEIVLAQPIEIAQLAAGAEKDFTFDFSASVIPINAWNLRLQVVFRGTLGAEPNAVAVSTVRVSAPTVHRYVNETDWIDIQQQLYRTRDIQSDRTLLLGVAQPGCLDALPDGPQSLRTMLVLENLDNGDPKFDAQGNRLSHYDFLCFPEWEAIRAVWKSGSTGTVLATSQRLFQDAQSVLVMLGDLSTPVSLDIRYPRTPDIPSMQLRPDMRSFFFRRLEWNDATNAMAGQQFWNYRGMHATNVTAPSWMGDPNAAPATWDTSKSRPPIKWTVPVPFESIDSRYQ